MGKVTGRELEVVYKDFRPGEVKLTWCEIDKAREGFGFDPLTPLEVGLRATWEWFQEQRPAQTG